MMITITPFVIANPQGEAIHAGILDCFTLRVRNDVAAGRLHESSFSLSALLKCSVFFPQDIPVNKTVPGHPEFSAGNINVFSIDLKNSAGGRIEEFVDLKNSAGSRIEFFVDLKNSVDDRIEFFVNLKNSVDDRIKFFVDLKNSVGDRIE